MYVSIDHLSPDNHLVFVREGITMTSAFILCSVAYEEYLTIRNMRKYGSIYYIMFWNVATKRFAIVNQLVLKFGKNRQV